MLVRLQLAVVRVRVLRQFLLKPAYYCIFICIKCIQSEFCITQGLPHGYKLRVKIGLSCFIFQQFSDSAYRDPRTQLFPLKYYFYPVFCVLVSTTV